MDGADFSAPNEEPTGPDKFDMPGETPSEEIVAADGAADGAADRAADETASEAYGAPEEEPVITRPVALYYALLCSVGLTMWGILGFIPPFTAGGALFDNVRVTTTANILHLVTGLPGLVVWRLGQRRYATWYAAFIGCVYFIYFFAGNIVFGNLEGTVKLDTTLHELQWIVYNALHAGLMLSGWLVAALSAMQRGDRATRRYRSTRRWFWISRTRVRPGH